MNYAPSWTKPNARGPKKLTLYRECKLGMFWSKANWMGPLSRSRSSSLLSPKANALLSLHIDLYSSYITLHLGERVELGPQEPGWDPRTTIVTLMD